MATINFIYYREYRGLTRTCLKTEHNYSDLDFDNYARGYYHLTEPHQRSVAEFEEIQEAVFKEGLFPQLVPGQYHAFIVTNEQLAVLQVDLKKTELSQYIVETLPVAVNSNYPEMGPRLHMFLLKLPKDFNNV